MAEHDPDASWFLAQVKPNSVNIAKRNLERQGFATFLPTAEETRKRGSRFVTAERPLFPGYIFVAFDVAEGLWRAVNSTAGITRLVSFGREPAPVPRDLVDQLMRRCEASGRLIPAEALREGDRVRVTKGPFADFVAEIETIAPDRRVWVLIEIMGGQTRMAVGADQLRSVER
ncbi:MAG: transcriptional activator RfaH [Maritimibacter sp.]|nr:transcriptional activator RfaH [Maritimibacter sp.]